MLQQLALSRLVFECPPAVQLLAFAAALGDAQALSLQTPYHQ